MIRVAGTLTAVLLVLLLAGCQGVDTDTGLFLTATPGGGGGGISTAGISPTTIDNNTDFAVSWTNPGNPGIVEFHINDRPTMSQSAKRGFTVNTPFVPSPVTCRYLYGSPPSITCTPSGGLPQGPTTFSFNLDNTVYGIISVCRFDSAIPPNLICDNTTIPLRFTIPSTPSPGGGATITTTPGGPGLTQADVSPRLIDNNTSVAVSWAFSGTADRVEFYLDNQATAGPNHLQIFGGNLSFITSPVSCLYQTPQPRITCGSFASVPIPFNLAQPLYWTTSVCTVDLNPTSPTFLDFLCDNAVLQVTFR